MNHYQQMTKKRLARRFSNGDGVLLKTGTATGERGHIVALGSGTAPYTIVLSTKDAVVSASENDFDSCPAANVGKYGGPSRGGSSERGAVSSHYRHHGRRR